MPGLGPTKDDVRTAAAGLEALAPNAKDESLSVDEL